MAYVSPELKAKLAPQIKAVLKKYNVKGSISVNNHSTLVVTVKSSLIDFIGNYNKTTVERDPCDSRKINKADGYIQVNTYHYNKHFSGKAVKFLKELDSAMNIGNYDHSDIQVDYFCVGFYTNINIGKWDKPYELTK
jgi:hypothetical protein